LNRDSETAKLILEIMVTIITSAIIWYLAKIVIAAASAGLPIDIGALIDALIMLVGGYILVSLLSRAVYRVVLRTSGEIAASSVRSAIRILGIGVLLAGAAGILTNPQAGLAIGGFIGAVAGLATQQVLSQAVAGLVILATRPFRIGDTIVIGS
jgi:small-conductance mechanosensitive channel